MGALIPASDWLEFYLLSPRTCTLARGSAADCAGFRIARSRWARLAGIRSRRSTCFPVGAFGWYRARSVPWQGMLPCLAKRSWALL